MGPCDECPVYFKEDCERLGCHSKPNITADICENNPVMLLSMNAKVHYANSPISFLACKNYSCTHNSKLAITHADGTVTCYVCDSVGTLCKEAKDFYKTED